MIRDFLKELIDKANHYSPIPGTDERCYYGDAWLSKARTAHSNAREACSYESEEDGGPVATYMWTKVFGEQYDD